MKMILEISLRDWILMSTLCLKSKKHDMLLSQNWKLYVVMSLLRHIVISKVGTPLGLHSFFLGEKKNSSMYVHVLIIVFFFICLVTV